MNKSQSINGSLMFDFNLSTTCLVLGLMPLGIKPHRAEPYIVCAFLYTQNLIHTDKHYNGTCRSSHIQFLDELTSKDKVKAPNNEVMLSH